MSGFLRPSTTAALLLLCLPAWAQAPGRAAPSAQVPGTSSAVPGTSSAVPGTSSAGTSSAVPGTSAARGGAGPSLRGSSRRVRLDTVARSGAGFVARLEGGAHAELTLDPRLQDAAEEVF